jgi:ATP-dependent RecD-like DNA helicase SH3 domain
VPDEPGGLGARSLNIELQTALNPPGETRIERFGWTFCPGDKVMQVENDYDKEVYNGDLGVVSRIDMEEGALTVDFDCRELIYGFGELDELVLAYATLSASTSFVLFSTQGIALWASINGQGGLPTASVLSFSAISRSARYSPARNTQCCASSWSAITAPA